MNTYKFIFIVYLTFQLTGITAAGEFCSCSQSAMPCVSSETPRVDTSNNCMSNGHSDKACCLTSTITPETHQDTQASCECGSIIRSDCGSEIEQTYSGISVQKNSAKISVLPLNEDIIEGNVEFLVKNIPPNLNFQVTRIYLQNSLLLI